MYFLVNERVNTIIDYDWMTENSKLALIGGIIINCDVDGTDMFVPMNFEIRTKDGKSTDLL